MDANELLNHLRKYEQDIDNIRSQFSYSQLEGYIIRRGDDTLLRQYVAELVGLFEDALGDPNDYGQQIQIDYNLGIRNISRSPSLRSVENISAQIKAAITRIERNPDLPNIAQRAPNIPNTKNVFIIHGREEAKWRELKDILSNKFVLTPIVLVEQPDLGCKTIIEKFEHYAPTCSYAMAVFTPDDEVTQSNGETYLQARPNVLYEIGWFCGRLTRSRVLLLLKEGTKIFSDFDGVMQKRFVTNISEKTGEIKDELVAAKIINPST